MNSTLLNLRYERKFLAARLSLAGVLALIRRHPAMFREAYPPRVVNNLYLDSPARRDYFDHVNGVSDRVKTRIRWYGGLSGHIERPNLERKIKRGTVGGKATCPLPAFHVNGGIAPPDLAATLDNAGLPVILRSALRFMEPVLANCYHRHYFQSADGGFRLTADSELQFFGLHPGTGAMTPVAAGDVPVIIELKFDLHRAEGAVPIANALPFRLARCSKYVLGIGRLLATEPAFPSRNKTAAGRMEAACLG
jgi:hypothetical protein